MIFSPLQKQKGSAVKKNRWENNGDEDERSMKKWGMSLAGVYEWVYFLPLQIIQTSMNFSITNNTAVLFFIRLSNSLLVT